MVRMIPALGLALAAAYFTEAREFQASSSVSLVAEGKEVRTYGASLKVGNGKVRSYVQKDAKGAPAEIGIAFDEPALENLPKGGSGHHDGHMETHEYILELPATHGTPFRFIEMNWNPSGHEPAGVYEGVPHFDFHFYTVAKAERDAIEPKDPRYAEKANNIPTGEYVPPFTAPLGPPGVPPSGVAVPMMGVHWVDLRSQELQGLLGKPEAYKPFTATFIYGSWDGRYHFWEPMITRAHILEKRNATDAKVRDEIIPIPVPKKVHVPGYYPSAYRIQWDPAAKEYRISLTQLAKMN